jgi:hypothetical protein
MNPMQIADGILLVLKLGVAIVEGITQGLGKPAVLQRVRSVIADVERIDGDVDDVARPRTAEARRREQGE